MEQGGSHWDHRVDEDVLVFTYAGAPTFEALKAFARETVRLAIASGFTKVLADLQGLEASPTAFDRLLLGSVVGDRWPRKVRLAVLIPRELNTPDHLFENSAAQKGVPVVVCDSYDEAMRWLHRAEHRP